MTELKVIGAGLGRTGTTSLKAALEILDLGPVHHMSTALQQPWSVVRLWEKVARGDEQALKTIFQGHTSTLDYPGCVHFAALLRWNPQARVVLTVRTSPQEWAWSARATIFSCSWSKQLLLRLLFLLPVTKLYYLQYIQQISFAAHGTNPLAPDCDLVDLYTRWIDYVVENVPAEQLLVYEVKDGWEPLCKFLDLPVPECPFPSLNTSSEYRRKSLFEKTGRLVCLAVTVTIIAVVALGLAFGLHKP